MKICPYCIDGLYTEGWRDYPAYECPYCGGTGFLREVGIDYWVCKICGRNILSELYDGICADCLDKLEEEQAQKEMPLSYEQIANKILDDIKKC